MPFETTALLGLLKSPCPRSFPATQGRDVHLRRSRHHDVERTFVSRMFEVSERDTGPTDRGRNERAGERARSIKPKVKLRTHRSSQASLSTPAPPRQPGVNRTPHVRSLAEWFVTSLSLYRDADPETSLINSMRSVRLHFFVCIWDSSVSRVHIFWSVSRQFRFSAPASVALAKLHPHFCSTI